MRRLSVIIAVLFLLTVSINTALAGTLYDATKAINDAEQQYSDYYQNSSPNVPGQDESLHYVSDPGLSKLTDGNGYSYGFLAYGQPHGDQKPSQSRYIGYTYFGEDFTNMNFPADQNANGADFASQNWINKPWEAPDKSVIASNDPYFTKFSGDGDSKYHAVTLAGIMAYGGTNASNGYIISSTDNPSFWSNIEQYVHILAPPTNYAWGIGRMWHYDANGNLLYITVPIAPFALANQPQLIVTPSTATVNVGGTQQYTATYYPQGQQAGGGQDVSSSSTWTVADSSIASIGTNTALATGKAQGTTQVTATYNNGSTTLQGTAQLTVQTQQEISDFTVDGCFLTMPVKEGDVFTTWVIRAPGDISLHHFKPYNLDQPVTARFKVYQFGPTNYANLPGTTMDGTTVPPDSVPHQLIYDEEVTFTKDNPAWAKKFSFPAPEDNSGYGLLVITDGGMVKNNGVSCSAFGSVGLQVSSHTTYDGYYSTLPWDYITATYGISHP